MGIARSRYALILAAGKGTRFKSEKPKVLHEVCGKPMICYLLDRLPELDIQKAFVVVGQGAEQVQEALKDYPVEFVSQEQQLGTGHAVRSAVPALAGLTGSLIVLYGDTPLIQTSALEELIAKQEASDADEVLLTVNLEDPTGYGRILRDDQGRIFDIVEEKETTADQKRIPEVNAGFVCFEIEALVKCIAQLSNDNAAREYYLTDMVKILRRNGRQVETVVVQSAEEEIFGINDRQQLAAAALKLRARINTDLMKSGVTLIDPMLTLIDSTVRIGADTVIHPGVILEGQTTLGRDCTVGAYVHLSNAEVGNAVHIDSFSVIRNSRVGEGAKVGPFAHLRGETVVGKNAVVAAGSTVTKDVPEDALAIARSRQTNKTGWAKKNLK